MSRVDVSCWTSTSCVVALIFHATWCWQAPRELILAPPIGQDLDDDELFREPRTHYLSRRACGLECDNEADTALLGLILEFLQTPVRILLGMQCVAPTGHHGSAWSTKRLWCYLATKSQVFNLYFSTKYSATEYLRIDLLREYWNRVFEPYSILRRDTQPWYLV